MGIEAAFRAQLEAAGLRPGQVIADGQLHRCPVEGKPAARDGAYVLHPDFPPSGWYMNHRTGQEKTWTPETGRRLSEDELRQVEIARRQRESARKAVWAQAAQKALGLLARARPCASHPYLQAKGVAPCPGLKILQDGPLLVPILDRQGAVQSLQFIQPSGNKRFMRKAKMSGGHFLIPGQDPGPVLICEGLATGLSLHEATDLGVLVAFTANNLEAVAMMARDTYPEHHQIICADDDHATEGNPGLTRARQAALASGAKLALPQFAQPGTGTDFNDLHQAEGLEMVASQVRRADDPQPSPPTATETQFPDPVPFADQQPDLLPADVLPEWASNFVGHAAEHLQVSPDMVMANLLGAVATACQGKFRVQIRPGYQEPVNLYILCSALPGERKSATQALTTEPLVAWEREQAQAMESEIKQATSRLKSEQAIIEGLRRKLARANSLERSQLMQDIADLELALTKVPSSPRILGDDITPEAAASLMAEQGERLGIISAEGGLFDTLAGRYSNGVPNLDLFLKAHSGDPVRVDRRNGQHLAMQSPTLTLCLSTQPEVMRALAGMQGFRGRGLIARFAFVIPASLMGHRQASPPSIPDEVLAEYSRGMRTLLDLEWLTDEKGEPTPYILEFTPEAKQEWEEFYLATEVSLGQGGSLETLQDWGGKLPGLAARLAGLVHVMEHGQTAPGMQVAQASMHSASELASALLSHAMAAVGAMGADPVDEVAKLALAWIVRERLQQFEVRDCCRILAGRGLKAPQVKDGLGVLEERGFIFAQKRKKSGPGRPPSLSYLTNPKTWDL